MTNKDVSFDEFCQICGEAAQFGSDYVLKSLTKMKDKKLSGDMLKSFMIFVMMQPILSFMETNRDGFEAYRQQLLLVIHTLGVDISSLAPQLKKTLDRSFKNDSDAINEYMAQMNRLNQGGNKD